MPHAVRSLSRRIFTPLPSPARHLFSALALALGLSGIAGTAYAQTPTSACSQASTILEKNYPGARRDPDLTKPANYLMGEHRLMLPDESSDTVVSMVCKAWPAHDKLLLVAVPRMLATASLVHDRIGDLDILVVDRATLKAQQRLSLPNAMSDDTIRIQRLEFDTARYVIAPKVQAFGVRTVYESGSRAVPFYEESLSLFAMGDGDTGPLRPVLEKLSVSRSSGHWDTTCTGEFLERNATLAMTSQAHQGLYDIRVTLSSTSSKSELVGRDKSECKETASKTTKTQHVLSYDGKRYVIPADLKGM